MDQHKPGLPNYNISDVAVSDNDPNRLWVTMSEYNASNKVFESTNGGATWTNITGTNLPNLPVNCIVHQVMQTKTSTLAQILVYIIKIIL